MKNRRNPPDPNRPPSTSRKLYETHKELNPRAPKRMPTHARKAAVKRLASKAEHAPSGRGWLRGAR